MSTRSSLEARISVQERRLNSTDLRVEELAESVAASFDDIDKNMRIGFDQVTTYFKEVEEKMEQRFNKIEAAMATKDDLQALEGKIATNMTTLENRMLAALTQLITLIDPKHSREHEKQ